MNEQEIQQLVDKIIQALEPSLDNKIAALKTNLNNPSQPALDSDKFVTNDALEERIKTINQEIGNLKTPLQDKAEIDEIKTLIRGKINLLKGNILLWNFFKYSALMLTVILSFAAFFVLTLEDKTSLVSAYNNTSQTPTPNNFNSPASNFNLPQSSPSNLNSNIPPATTGNVQTPTPNGNFQTPTPNSNPQIPNNNNSTFYKNLAGGLTLFAALFALLHLSLVFGYKRSSEEAYKKINQLEMLELELTDREVPSKEAREKINKIISSP